MTTNIALIILLITIIGLFFIIYNLLKLITNLAKMIKSDNLQEYVMGNELEKKGIVDVEQPDERYQDVSSIDSSQLKNMDLNPENIYKGVIGTDFKKENFN